MRYVLACLLALRASAAAQEVQTSTGILCDTAEQVARYVSLSEEGVTAREALYAVNTEAHAEHACVVSTVAYVRGETTSQMPVNGGRVEIARITIIGLHARGQWLRVQPSEQFAAFFEKETGA
jgi:hypothetical protein